MRRPGIHPLEAGVGKGPPLGSPHGRQRLARVQQRAVSRGGRRPAAGGCQGGPLPSAPAPGGQGAQGLLLAGGDADLSVVGADGRPRLSKAPR
ncbi:MAG TPA: hypothetical protein ENF48_01010 [Desulfobacteraceae bacterium]|nr:hypothetical protein [Desulfobacteraceae bacterium]